MRNSNHRHITDTQFIKYMKYILIETVEKKNTLHLN